MRDLAIVIPIYISNEEEIIFATLDNIKHFKNNIFVPWNGTPKTSNVISRIQRHATTHEVPSSTSKSENLNSLFRVLPQTFKYILILDADSMPSGDSIELMYNTLKRSREHIGWLQGKYTFDRGGNKFLNLLDESENVFTKNFDKFTIDYFNVNFTTFRGHDAMFKRHVLEKINYFDTKLLVEDADLKIRLNKLHYYGEYFDIYVSSSESCATMENFCKQRSRWVQGHYQISRINIYFTVVIYLIVFVCLFFYPLYTLLVLLIFYASFAGALAIFMIINIPIRFAICIQILLGFGPKKFISTPRS